ncbi:hypothetical protein BU26DRAFT_461975 [Trematosphaeria pertusa]|uniref:Rhodopsin domain-containing protein n=1 Tax=Trematosphaeria pertusa TaxID=390896 RepID=A0A6A6I7W7_9PLEO|nr:uncharacterized protein BU26DRAFT_461975 [Trematosphaeria pertusa]KAF2246309.1 hypothetical protein BU26DRAFT_461975 [Trematosphaeria pertusa]
MTLPSEGDADRGGLMIKFLWSFGGIAGVILATGLYAKIRLLRHLRSTDYMVIMAYICAIIQNALLTEACRWGLGRHSRYLDRAEKYQTMKFIFLCQGWGVASPMFGRISICLLLLNFVVSNLRLKWFLWFLVITQAVVNILTIVLIYVQCGSHVSALWDPEVDAKCWSPLVQRNFGFFQCAWNSFTDLAFTVLPTIMLRGIKLPWAKKVGVIFLLSLSVIALIASIIKGYLIKELGARDDFTWNFITFQLWASAENYIVIICAIGPALRALLRSEKRSPTDEIYELGSGTRSSRLGAMMAQKWWSASGASHREKPGDDNGLARNRPGGSSQENILPLSEHCIVKRTDVDLIYEVEK